LQQLTDSWQQLTEITTVTLVLEEEEEEEGHKWKSTVSACLLKRP